jgi:Holliday junction resolvase-like predicted endonuclease
MNRISFETALKKGEIGENIVCKYLENRGWIVYKPFTKNKPHYFDILATLHKEKAIAVDVKTKARLNKWNAQGINIRHYKQYLRFIEKTNIPFYLIFVDDKLGDVYCADIKKLSNGFNPNKNIIAWYLSDMIYMFKITEKQIQELSEFDQRNYAFNPIETNQ